MAGIDDDEKLRAEAEIRRKIGAWMEDQASRPPPTASDYRRMWWGAVARKAGLGVVEIIKVALALLLFAGAVSTCDDTRKDARDRWESGEAFNGFE